MIDHTPRDRPPEELLASLSDLAYLVVEQMEFRCAVAARLRADAARSQAEERYRLFGESAREVFLIVDSSGVVRSANRASRAVLGFSATDLMGRSFAQVVPDYNLVSGEYERNARHASGADVPVEISVSEFESAGRMSAVILRDITVRKASEAALRSAVDALRSALGEKEVLLKEVHHRVKNNLQVILSLLQMQANAAGNPAVADILCESQQRVHSMSLIHETLCGGGELSTIDFAEYTNALVRELFYGYSDRAGNVVSRIEASAVRLNLDQAIPCGLILNELITNALKYAYPDGARGEIAVELSEVLSENAANRIRLCVSDKGTGLPDGLDWRRGGSLGSRIVSALVRQLKGTLNIGTTGEAGASGARFEVEFPAMKTAATSLCP